MRSRQFVFGSLGVAAIFAACNFHEVDEADPGSGSSDGDPGSTGTGATTSSNGGGTQASSNGAAGPGGMGVGGAGTGAVPNEAGLIACGETTCDSLQEKCCSQTTCLPLDADCPTRGLGVDAVFSEMACDDDADCPMGNTCCVDEHAKVPEGLSYTCELGTCGLYASCTPGGACAPGFVCVDDPTEPTGAKCTGDGASVACGDMLACSGSAPVCCTTQGTPACAAFGGCADGDNVYECDDAADCGAGYVCCAASDLSSSVCTGSCKDPVFCAADNDCQSGSCLPAGAQAPSTFKTCQ